MTTFQKYFAHAVQVFIPVFLMSISSAVQGGITWSWTFWGAIIIAAISVGIKAIFSQTAVPLIGGVKQ
jgi:hypothetical protein